jgi:hypothetical protein
MVDVDRFTHELCNKNVLKALGGGLEISLT